MKNLAVSLLIASLLAPALSAQVCQIDAACEAVTVMELYTPAAAQAYGGIDALAGERGVIRVAVAQLMRDLYASGVTDRTIQLVYVGQLDFPHVDKFTLLNSLPNDQRVTQLRSLYCADLVGVWTDGADGAIAFLPNLSVMSPLTGRPYPGAEATAAASGFSVFGYGGDPLFFYSHERGHNFGMQHDDVPISNDDRYGFARGYCGQVRDLMASTCTSPVTAHAFSNPLTTWSGYNVGDAAHDNVRMLRLTWSLVSSYR